MIANHDFDILVIRLRAHPSDNLLRSSQANTGCEDTSRCPCDTVPHNGKPCHNLFHTYMFRPGKLRYQKSILSKHLGKYQNCKTFFGL